MIISEYALYSADMSEEAVGVAIAAPPSDGEANTELIAYLAKVLQLKKSELVLYKVSCWFRDIMHAGLVRAL